MNELSYDKDTGIFTWNIKRKRVNPGDKAGYVASDGYLIIGINGRRYPAHRLAWFFMNGEFPKEQIDHIDGYKLNNSIKNLREASHGQNQHNRAMLRNNTSGVKGVYFHKASGVWRAYCMVDKKQNMLGSFSDIKDAERAVIEFRAKNHKQFTNNGTFKKDEK